jgi:hypothetical protein
MRSVLTIDRGHRGPPRDNSEAEESSTDFADFRRFKICVHLRNLNGALRQESSPRITRMDADGTGQVQAAGRLRRGYGGPIRVHLRHPRAVPTLR